LLLIHCNGGSAGIDPELVIGYTLALKT